MTIHWAKGSSGDWSVAANWVGDAVPPAGSDVAIDATAVGSSYTVTLDVSTSLDSIGLIAPATLLVSLGSMTLTAGTGAGVNAGTIMVSTGSLTVGGTFVNLGLVEATSAALDVDGAVIVQTQAGTAAVGLLQASGSGVVQSLVNTDIQGGKLHTTGGAEFSVPSFNYATLDGSVSTIALSGTLAVANGSSIFLLGTINTTGGVIELQGAGNDTGIALLGNVALTGGGQVSLGDSSVDQIISGTDAAATLTNVTATITGGGVIGGGGNGGLGLANAAAGVIAGGAAANEMLITALAGTFTNRGLVEAATTAGLELRGVSLDNTVATSGTVANAGTLLASGGSLWLTGGTVVRGGTLASANGNAIHVTGGQSATLDGTATGAGGSRATSNVTGLVVVDNNANLALEGTIGGGGTISLQSGGNSTDLIITQAGTLATVLGGGEQIVLATNNSNNHVVGAAGTDDLMVSSATISGVGSIGSLTLQNGAGGVVNANGAGQLEIATGANASTNAGLIEATAAGGLLIAGSTIANTGTVLATGSGVVHLESSDIQGGSVAGLGGGVQVDSGDGATLDGSAAAVTLTGVFTIANNAQLDILGTIDNLGTIVVASAGNDTVLDIDAVAVTLTGSGNVQMADNSNSLIRGGAVTVDSVATVFELVNVNNIITGGGQIGQGQLNIDNQGAGTIDATGANALVINVGAGNSLTNEGLLEASNPGSLASPGGLVVYATTINNSGSGNAGVVLANGNDVNLQNGASIKGGTLKTANGGIIVVDGGNNGTVDGSSPALTNSGTLEAANNAALYLLGTILNTGSIVVASIGNGTDLVIGSHTMTLTGTGDVVMGDNINNIIIGAVAGDKLINSQNTIIGSGQLGDGRLTMDNQSHGVIIANGTASGMTIDTGGGTFTNEGLIETTGTEGLAIASTTITNTGSILAAGAGTHVDLVGGAELIGGTAGSTGGGVLVVDGGNGGTLDGPTGITLVGTVEAANNSDLTLLGTILNKSVLDIASSANNTGLLVGSATVTLTDSGSVVLSDLSQNIIEGDVAADKLVNVNNTISGSGQFGNGQLSVDNQVHGVIIANGTANGMTINVGSGTFTNEGTIEAAGTGLLVIQSAITSTGTIEAVGAAAQIQLQNGGDIIGGIFGSSGGIADVAGGNTGTLDGTGTIRLVGTVQANNNSDLVLLGTVLNKGTLQVESGGNATFLLVGSATVTLTDSGSVLLSDNANNYIEGLAAADKLVNINNTISGSGQFGNGQLSVDNQLHGLIVANGAASGMTISIGSGIFTNEGTIEATGTGLLAIQSAITNTGSILAVGATAEIQLQNGGDLIGGRFGSTGGGVAATVGGQTGTLDGTGTITLVGTVDDANNSDLVLLGTVLNTGTLEVTSSGNTSVLLIGSPTVTLSGGGTLALSDNANNYIEGTAGTNLLVNVNNTIIGSGQIGNGQLAIDNQAAGKIIANGAAAGMTINTGGNSFTNEGLIETTGTEGLAIESKITNTGSILAAGTGTSIGLANGGIVAGGTFGSTGGGVAATLGGQTGTLDGTGTITLVGTVDDANNSDLVLLGTVLNTGTLEVTSGGNTSVLLIGSPTVTLGGGGTLALSDNSNNYIEGTASTNTLVNLNDTIVGAGQFGNGQLNVTNAAAGIIDGSGANQLTINAGTIDNLGLIEATGAGGVGVTESQLHNFSFVGTAATLTGGSFAAISSALTIGGTSFATLKDAASLTLSGTGQITIGGSAIDTLLNTITSTGLLAVLGGRNFAATNAINIAAGGVLRLGGGTLSTTASGGITSAGLIVGFGSIATTGVITLRNTGTIEANGGLLKLGTLIDVGALQVDGGATLEVPNATSDTVTFNGLNATLRLDNPNGYTGTLDGAAPGSRIDLVGISIASANFSGDSLVVHETGGATLTYALGAAPTGDLLQVGSIAGAGTITVYGLAQPGTIAPNPIAFGNLHVGATVTQALTLSNGAPNNGYYENLDASIADTGTGVTTSGTLTRLAPQQSNSSALDVTLNTKTDGVMTGTVLVTQTSDGTGIDGLPVTVLGTTTIAATGTIYALAAPSLATTSLTFAAARVGTTGQTLHDPLSNGTTADPFQESLAFVVKPLPALLTAATAIHGTIAAGGSFSLGYTLNTTTSGKLNAAPVTVTLTSDAGGVGLSNTTLTSETIAVTAQVFQTAIASFGTVVNFGIVHPGQTVDASLAVGNTATGALVDSLLGQVATIAGAPVTASGSVKVASLGTGSLGFTLDAGGAGIIAGSATIALASHDMVLADATLTAGTVALTGTVDNYAVAALGLASGAGTYAAAGTNVATLTLAAVLGTNAASVLQAGNAATGPADALAGSFAESGPGTGSYGNTGLAGFSGLAAGQSAGNETITLNAAGDGYAIEQVVLNGTGSNASGYSGAVAAQTLDVLGAIGNAVVASGTQTIALTSNETIVATGGVLAAGDAIGGSGTGTNAILLLGAGTFNLAAPGHFTHVTSVIAMEGQQSGGGFADQSQTVDLRAGVNLTVNVMAEPSVLVNAANPNAPTITINGANDSSVINLGAGNDIVTLGAATEKVNGGAGSATVDATAGTAGAAVAGSASGGAVTMDVTGGGTVRLNSADSHLTVALVSASNLSLGTGTFLTAVGDVAGNTIAAGATGQTLGGLAGSDKLSGFSGFGDTFLGTSAGLNNDTIKLFGGSDTIDLTDMSPSATLGYTGNTTQGVLTLSDGIHSASITMTGNYVKADFAIGTDHHGGAQITFV